MCGGRRRIMTAPRPGNSPPHVSGVLRVGSPREMHYMMRSELIQSKLLDSNDLCRYISCSVEAFLPSYLQKTQDCRTIDGLSSCSASVCGHMWPPPEA